MATWKYHAMMPTGVSVFGVFDADDQAALGAWLATRQLTLVQATELSINAALTGGLVDVPEMVRLRIGERLREALLTDLPAHQAIRAIASEPLEHPLLMLMPWLFVCTVFLSAVLGLVSLMIPESLVAVRIVSPLLLLTLGLVWFVLHRICVVRPRLILNKLADRLERGESTDLVRHGMLPRELRCVLEEPLDSRTQAATLAELIPELGGIRLNSHRFALVIIGPALALGLLLIGVCVLLQTIVPQFKGIFQGFGVELPWLTLLTVAASDLIAPSGAIGLGIIIACVFGVMGLIYFLAVWPRTAEFVEPVPLLGLSVRWQIQSRVARILSVLLRNEAPPDQAISVATRASGYPAVAADGAHISASIRSGSPLTGVSRRMSGLPLSLLVRVRQSDDSPQNRNQMAQSFQLYAAALENAATGNGAMFAVIFEMLVILLAAFLVGMCVIAMFLPLIKLLNDLAVVAMPLTWFGGQP